MNSYFLIDKIVAGASIMDQKSLTSIIRKYAKSLCPEQGCCYIDDDLTDKVKNKAIKDFGVDINPEEVVCVVNCSSLPAVKTGLLFTLNKLYYLPASSRAKKIWYDEIDVINYLPSANERFSKKSISILMKDGSNVRLSCPHVNLRVMAVVLGLLKQCTVSSFEGDSPNIKYKNEPTHSGSVASGYAVSTEKSVGILGDQEKFHAHQGHGFAAERANNLYDKVHGKDARIVGNDNVKNGPDRVSDGVWIQSKYCATGSRCVDACFEDNGKGTFRYLKNNKPMVVEVPKDEQIYNDAVKRMEQRILENKVPGVSDPADAKKFIKRGNFTYEQAKNIAKPGNIDSLMYDTVNGMVTSTSAFGISAVLAFATSIWNGEPFDVSLKKSAFHGLKIGGTALVTSVVSSQLTRSGLNSALVNSSESIARAFGTKTSSLIVNAFRTGSNVYGAAAIKSAAKIIRSNAITAVVTVAVLSSYDVVDIFRHRISGGQLLKNIITTSSSVIGGTVGWIGGAAAGSVVAPGVGTFAGGLAGSAALGSATSVAANKVTNIFIKDDAIAMCDIIQARFEIFAQDYLLNRCEAEKIVDHLQDKLDAKTLKEMHASSDRNKFADGILIPLVEAQVNKRPRIQLPSSAVMENAVIDSIEELISENEELIMNQAMSKEKMDILLDEKIKEYDLILLSADQKEISQKSIFEVYGFNQMNSYDSILESAVEHGTVLLDDRNNGCLDILVGGGIGGMNLALVLVRFVNEDMYIASFAKEGFINQGTAAKAIKKIIRKLLKSKKSE